MNLIFYILILPFVFMIAKSIWSAISPSINDTIEEIFPEKSGCFGYKELDFKDILNENKIYSLTYLVTHGYMKCRIIEKDGSTYRTLYLNVDKDVYNLLNKNYPELMNSNEIKNDNLKDIIPFLLEKCRFYKFKIKLSDADFKYHVGIRTKDDVQLKISNINNQYQEIKDILDNNTRIRWNFAYLKPSYRYEYEKMLKTNWQSQNDSIPENWFYFKYSKEWNRVRDNEILEKIKN